MSYLNCPQCRASNKASDAQCYSCGGELHAPQAATREPSPSAPDLGGVGPLRALGSLLCWVQPDRLFQETASTQTDWRDYVSHILGVGIFYGVLLQTGIQLAGINDSGTVFGASFAGTFFLSIPAMLFCFGITWAFSVALGDHEVNGKVVTSDYGSLLRANLHIHAGLLAATLVTMLVGHPVLWLLLALLVVRALDLTARSLLYITGESRAECYKMAAVLFAILLATIGVLSYLQG